MKRFAMILSLSLGVVGGAGAAQAESSREAPRALPSAAPAADQEYSRGMAAKNAKNWPAAVGSFQKAVSLRPAFPEAWNELGFALRSQGNYPESLKAYDEALRLRPNFPEALEYLGEAYVKLGRVADAHKILERLKPLDAARAAELSEAIAKGN
ncbi:MAG TPA: tetratricopeptide repeat protein [Methylomirabilota bacterium]|jgi:tetratricopeptide (TPR) repeat protein|nr:tetratricopeptide repeat protein [Methylomirabilota bacterium]